MTMLDGGVLVKSYLLPEFFYPEGHEEGLREFVKSELMRRAVRDLGPGKYISRTLHPGDMPPTGTTTREWIETTTGGNTFVGAAIGDGTAINDKTYIGLFGLQWLSAELSDGEYGAGTPPVTSLRLTVGGTRAAEWDLYSTFQGVAYQGTPVNEFGPQQQFPRGLAASPIFVDKRQPFLLEYYEIESTLDFSIQLLGYVVEQVGGTDGLNPGA